MAIAEAPALPRTPQLQPAKSRPRLDYLDALKVLLTILAPGAPVRIQLALNGAARLSERASASADFDDISGTHRGGHPPGRASRRTWAASSTSLACATAPRRSCSPSTTESYNRILWHDSEGSSTEWFYPPTEWFYPPYGSAPLSGTLRARIGRAMPRTVEPGRSQPEGATWDAERGGTNFSLFARNATRVELCLFDPDSGNEVERVDLPERVEHVWRGMLPDISPGVR